MYNNNHSRKNKHIVLKIPASVLSNQELSFNNKLVYGLDYAYHSKKGYNRLTNNAIGELLNLHRNIVSESRKTLVKEGFLYKDKLTYTLTERHKQVELSEKEDKREIILPYEIYNHKYLSTGAKLLWGEYNSISKGVREYFARRSYTAKRLKASVESITNWTKQLEAYVLLKKYEHRTGFCTNQKVIVTCEFKDGKKIMDITHIQNPQGEWVLRRPKMLGFEEWE